MMADNPDNPGTGFLGWLGRQVGYVKKAVKTDVTKETVHREVDVQEANLPGRPEVKFRRTTIDEVIVQKRLQSDEAPPRQSDEATQRRSDEGGAGSS